MTRTRYAGVPVASVTLLTADGKPVEEFVPFVATVLKSTLALHSWLAEAWGAATATAMTGTDHAMLPTTVRRGIWFEDVSCTISFSGGQSGGGG
ncbi:hypothetical protein C5C12_06480 [Pseudoclavibacter sp. RFBJ5]|nr:hypothetical protein C5C12_06480 [Pseudoclavibacter sp. RFBJ5]